MTRSRSRRLGTIVLMVLSLLFMQAALAQYVCPSDPLGSGTRDEAVPMQMEPGQPCSGMEPESESPQLCHHHCSNLAQSFEPVKLPTVTLPAIVQVIVLPLRVGELAPQSLREGWRVPAQPPPAPLFLSTLRLRV